MKFPGKPPLLRPIAAAISVLAALVVVACDAVLPVPTGAEPMTPLANYAAWWGQVEQCSGLSRSMSDISWFAVPGGAFPSSTGQGTVNAIFRVGEDKIFIGGDFVRDGGIVRHEMLHALINAKKGTQHPRSYFLDKCAGVVLCNTACVVSSDPEPDYPANTQTVSPAAVNITVQVIPDTVSRTSLGGLGWGQIAVTVNNPGASPVVVDNGSGPSALQTFGYEADHAGAFFRGASLRVEKSQVYFTPGQSKTFYFDVYSTQLQAVGAWSVIGSFRGVQGTKRAVLTVTP